MTNRPANASAPTIGLGDIYYILFRHKWKILLICGAGILLALLLPLLWRLPYQSEAKLFIRYVMESKSPGQIGAANDRIKSPDERGENIINSELEILTSLDLAQEVVSTIGADKILAKAGGGSDPQKAALVVHKGLLPDVPKKSNVIRVIFQHPDPTIVQPVLVSLVEIYLKKHGEIHRSVGVFDEFLRKETDERRGRLLETEGDLRKAKINAGVISLEDTKKAFTDQISKVQQAIYDAEAELAEHQAAMAEMTKLLHPDAALAHTNDVTSAHPTASLTSSNAIAGPNDFLATNTLAAASNIQPGTEQSNNASVQASEAPVPSDKLAEYKRLGGLLESLTKREQDLLVQFTPENSLVKSTQAQLAENRKLKQDLEDQYPSLLAVRISEPRTVAEVVANPRMDLAAETARVAALQSKIKVLNSELDQIRKQATSVDAMEGSITELQRKKELEESHYKYFAANLEQSRIDEVLSRGPGRVSNISTIQAPSPPFRDSIKLQKARLMLLVGGIAAAFGLAFILELYFDRSLKRPAEIEAKLGLPLFISIPLVTANGKPHFLKAIKKLPQLPWKSRGHPATSDADGNPTEHVSQITLQESGVTNHEPAVTSPSTTNHQPAINSVASWDPRYTLRPFYETLRDRLMTYFEVRNLTHKPKLVALTSCGDGAGVTTTAAGLAACLSETGDGNVLLVDMNGQQGKAHHFYNGRLDISLDEILENGKRNEALVQDNLYVACESTNGDKLPRVLPKRFKHLVPKLKASDYDYIIFDMPPISQISATPRLAGFMDMVFVVVESEKTDRDVVKRASALLTESKATVGIVLNKACNYVPKQLQQEL